MFRLSFLTMHMTYMLVKHMKLLRELQILDPRLSYVKQMEIVYDKPKAFMREWIGLTGSTVSIHQYGRLHAGPVIYVHPKLKLLDLALILGHLDKTASFFAEPRVFRYPLIRQWLNKMGVIKKGGDQKTNLEQIEEYIRKGQSFILSEDDDIDYHSLSGRLNVPIVPVETAGTEEMIKGIVFKRLRAVDLDLTIHPAYVSKEKKQFRA
ncbi:1-acyl-sn-glycerol-3-phosphate acyltransferase [Bacillus sp. WMMC1349]|uniref:1-acyl-sn-glycerol-3-phosphate acyltransferase n=1 Tax=Bacillus sp. WMMC1349 TaxID=2736254 RepID=UPI00155549DC|nr:1-acyl-sn-glycerol-3-phosphate acyltransferase [Bacillus sp. WMMC1349]NPC92731.1 1-acyl-sn-glycerol-3-phosphate acyltransferase [Bacillus sp. WMMC1349]